MYVLFLPLCFSCFCYVLTTRDRDTSEWVIQHQDSPGAGSIWTCLATRSHIVGLVSPYPAASWLSLNNTQLPTTLDTPDTAASVSWQHSYYHLSYFEMNVMWPINEILDWENCNILLNCKSITHNQHGWRESGSYSAAHFVNVRDRCSDFQVDKIFKQSRVCV